ncbi:branched-chain amino acid ABC transporter permease [Salarchaeum sp. JOR-1]|uniref:branched-chain amino acid ABC transporter permease n=1 Tax=Salarchaeum sp. JOR-1 TaxID=2599399 RepID=UPI0011988FF4|nr:branched-chain amino acid ABC transporter permease [Salarchaeum sp. JOR-1]QDX41428.1 branched-chain amino acid ABC transporter permease [Salarchaeum sp. JOR-1]
MGVRSIVADPSGYWNGLTRAEQGVSGFIVAFVVLLLFGLLTGGLAPTYFLFLVGLAGMYALMSLGLNVQWGYTGLINFSVAAFFGIGAYGTALASSSSSPIAGDLAPVVGLLVALVLAAVLALLIGIPTLRLRADYLAIASIGLAEVVRIIILNEDQWTNGSAGLRGIPTFFDGWPVLSTFPQTMPGIAISWLPGETIVLRQSFWQATLNVTLVLAFIGVSYFVLKRAHRSPWGRLLRTIRGDEDLARALGKNTYRYKMQAFVLGSLIMALAGVFYAHLNLYVGPGDLNPITTFYVWVAVILGGSGSNRGALFGGFVIVAIQQGTRFLNDFGWIPFDVAPLRLLVIGVIIVLIMRFRPEGVLPPQRELIWPSVVDEAPKQPDTGVRDAKAGESE